MEARLQRLIGLWSRSLEQGLDRSQQRELDALLADAPLCEQLAQWQAAAAPGETEPSADTPRLDAAVRAAYRNRLALRRWLPWFLLAGLGSAGLMAWAGHAGSGRTQALPVAVEEQPDAFVDATLKPAKKRSLGPPPGYGQRPTRLQSLGDHARLAFNVPVAGPVRVEVLDPADRCVRTLFEGPLPVGAAARSWDGTDDAGQALPQGRYRLRARTYTDLLAEKQVELSPAP